MKRNKPKFPIFFRDCIRVGLFVLVMYMLPLHAAKENEEDDLDHLALAALMIRDGHYDRAENVLENVDPTDETTDQARYYTLRGLVLLHRGLFRDCASALNTAIEKGQDAPIVHVYLAQAYLGLEQWQKALDALNASGEEGRSVPESYILRAQCHWNLKHYEKAWSALEEGLQRFPQHPALQRRQVFTLVELKLFQEAVNLAQTLLSPENAKPEDGLAVAEALIRSGEARRAIELLETLRLRFPDHADMAKALAHAWHEDGKPLAAAAIFEEVARTEPAFAFETAELYRQAGRIRQALYWNSRIDDQKKKIRQRLGLLLQVERFEMAAALESRLSRLGLLEDEEIRYALAYALFKCRDFSRCETHLKHLTRSDLFQNANQLRLAMESCRSDHWECY